MCLGKATDCMSSNQGGATAIGIEHLLPRHQCRKKTRTQTSSRLSTRKIEPTRSTRTNQVRRQPNEPRTWTISHRIAGGNVKRFLPCHGLVSFQRALTRDRSVCTGQKLHFKMVGTIPSGLAHVEAIRTSIQAQRNMRAKFLKCGKQEPELHMLGTRYASVLDWCGRCVP